MEVRSRVANGRNRPVKTKSTTVTETETADAITIETKSGAGTARMVAIATAMTSTSIRQGGTILGIPSTTGSEQNETGNTAITDAGTVTGIIATRIVRGTETDIGQNMGETMSETKLGLIEMTNVANGSRRRGLMCRIGTGIGIGRIRGMLLLLKVGRRRGNASVVRLVGRTGLKRWVNVCKNLVSITANEVCTLQRARYEQEPTENQNAVREETPEEGEI